MDVKVLLAQASHTIFAETICLMMEDAANKRGTGIAKREPAYLVTKGIGSGAFMLLALGGGASAQQAPLYRLPYIPELHDKVREAADLCPTAAISLDT